MDEEKRQDGIETVEQLGSTLGTGPYESGDDDWEKTEQEWLTRNTTEPFDPATGSDPSV